MNLENHIKYYHIKIFVQLKCLLFYLLINENCRIIITILLTMITYNVEDTVHKIDLKQEKSLPRVLLYMYFTTIFSTRISITCYFQNKKKTDIIINYYYFCFFLFMILVKINNLQVNLKYNCNTLIKDFIFVVYFYSK